MKTKFSKEKLIQQAKPFYINDEGNLMESEYENLKSLPTDNEVLNAVINRLNMKLGFTGQLTRENIITSQINGQKFPDFVLKTSQLKQAATPQNGKNVVVGNVSEVDPNALAKAPRSATVSIELQNKADSPTGPGGISFSLTEENNNKITGTCTLVCDDAYDKDIKKVEDFKNKGYDQKNKFKITLTAYANGTAFKEYEHMQNVTLSLTIEGTEYNFNGVPKIDAQKYDTLILDLTLNKNPNSTATPPAPPTGGKSRKTRKNNSKISRKVRSLSKNKNAKTQKNKKSKNVKK